MAHRINFEKTDVNQDFLVQLESMTQFRTAVTNAPNNTKSRTDNKFGLRLDDAFMNAFQSIILVEHYRAWREKSAMLSAVLNDRHVQQTIKLKFGAGMANAIKVHLEDMTKGAVIRQDAWMNAIMTIVHNAGHVMLGLKPIQYLKQWTSIFNFALHVNTVDFLTGINEYFEDPAKANAILEQSETFKSRYANLSGTLTGAVAKQDLEAFKKKAIREFMLLPLKVGDKHVVRAGGWAVYSATFKKTGSHEKAMAAFEKAFNTTQSSGTIDQINNLARHPLGKILMMFLQQPTRMLEFKLTAARDFVANPTFEGAVHMIRTVAVVHLAQAAFAAIDLAWMYAISNDDDEGGEKDKAFLYFITEVLMGPQTAILGEALSAAFAIGHNTIFPDEPKMTVKNIDLIPVEAAKSTVAFAERAAKIASAWAEGDEVEEKEYVQLGIDFSKSLINLGTVAVPAEPPLKLLKRYFEEKYSWQ